MKNSIGVEQNMTKKRIMRLVSWVLVIFLLSMSVSVSVSAVDSDFPFREFREPPEPSAQPQWEEMEVTCRSGDNLLRGTLTVPTGISGKVPMAILLHGLSTDRHWCDDIAWILADNGIASVRFDFAGTGESDGAQEDMTVSSEVQDTLAIIEYAKKLYFTDEDNLFVVGKSMGAVDALLASQQAQGTIKAMCLWYPGFAVRDNARHGFLLGSTFDPENVPETVDASFYTYGKGFIEEVQEIDYESAIRSYDGPVMIIHGTNDFVAPLFFSFQVEDLFKDLTMKVVPGGYHGFYGFQELDALNDMLEFFQQHID